MTTAAPYFSTYPTSEASYRDDKRSSPTPSELTEIKEFEGLITTTLRKKSWKNKEILSEFFCFTRDDITSEEFTLSIYFSGIWNNTYSRWDDYRHRRLQRQHCQSH